MGGNGKRQKTKQKNPHLLLVSFSRLAATGLSVNDDDGRVRRKIHFSFLYFRCTLHAYVSKTPPKPYMVVPYARPCTERQVGKAHEELPALQMPANAMDG